MRRGYWALPLLCLAAACCSCASTGNDRLLRLEQRQQVIITQHNKVVSELQKVALRAARNEVLLKKQNGRTTQEGVDEVD